MHYWKYAFNSGVRDREVKYCRYLVKDSFSAWLVWRLCHCTDKCTVQYMYKAKRSFRVPVFKFHAVQPTSTVISTSQKKQQQQREEILNQNDETAATILHQQRNKKVGKVEESTVKFLKIAQLYGTNSLNNSIIWLHQWTLFPIVSCEKCLAGLAKVNTSLLLWSTVGSERNIWLPSKLRRCSPLLFPQFLEPS